MSKTQSAPSINPALIAVWVTAYQLGATLAQLQLWSGVKYRPLRMALAATDGFELWPRRPRRPLKPALIQALQAYVTHEGDVTAAARSLRWTRDKLRETLNLPAEADAPDKSAEPAAKVAKPKRAKKTTTPASEPPIPGEMRELGDVVDPATVAAMLEDDAPTLTATTVNTGTAAITIVADVDDALASLVEAETLAAA